MTLFAYGSLMFPTVWQEVVGRDFATTPAVLDGHTAFCVTGHTFPALVPDDPAASTSGLVYFDVDAAATARLDAFEGTFFHRVPVTVRLESGETIPAEAFLATPARRAGFPHMTMRGVDW